MKFTTEQIADALRRDGHDDRDVGRWVAAQEAHEDETSSSGRRRRPSSTRRPRTRRRPARCSST